MSRQAPLLVALGLGLSVVAFVAPSSGRPASHDAGSYSKLRENFLSPEVNVESEVEGGWAAQALAVSMALGLVAGLLPMSLPARAESTEFQVVEQLEAGKKETKEERLAKLVKEQNSLEDQIGGISPVRESQKFRLKTTVKEEKSRVKEKDEGGFQLPSVKLPGLGSIPSFIPPPKPPTKNKIIVSPADDLDEDELNPFRPNPVLGWTLLLTPSVIFYIFWILGSKGII